MLFLCRCAFWIALVFLVVPMITGPRGASPPPAAPATSTAAPAAGTPGVAELAAGTALGALVNTFLAAPTPVPAGAPESGTSPAGASPAGSPHEPNVAVLSDIVRFCGEHGTVCEAGFSAIDALGAAVGEGLTLVATLTSGEPAAPTDDGTRTVATTTIVASTAATPAAAGGTLTADDVAEPWRGTAAIVVAGSQAARLRLPPPDPRKRPGAPQG